MWALAHEGTIRHDFGMQDGNPIATCGYRGRYPLNYCEVTIPKCSQCLLLWQTYGKENEKCGDKLEK